LPDANGPLAARLARLIAEEGPISVARYMAEANAHYYATRDPLGAAGDFITAPEISQMFGELIGAWLADLWQRAGSPELCHYVELGPGRGTLAADALRAIRSAGLLPQVHLVETSPALRMRQAELLPRARWHESLDSLPDSAPMLVVANEFFDALPIRQFVAGEAGWCERLVGFQDGRFAPVIGPPIADCPTSERAPIGTIIESSPAAVATVHDLSERLIRQGGALLIIDYGHARSGSGDTFQAVRSHGFADPWSDPGECDLTAHVDFEALATAPQAAGMQVHGPVEQGAWLPALGIDLRADALARAAPASADEIRTARNRLVEEDQMGSLFKVMALSAPGWPIPAGFA
jgi:NADH dehydrogenase [ubiquinone] 1 alpha subcomplex assembly factor 7